ncbi:MAG: hypothetical protein WBP12_02035 [Candidatus Saccharimonas sp.]
MFGPLIRAVVDFVGKLFPLPDPDDLDTYRADEEEEDRQSAAGDPREYYDTTHPY